MINIQDLMDHIATEEGVSISASYPFKTGYLIGMLDELQLRCPEVRETLESHAREYNYVETEQ